MEIYCVTQATEDGYDEYEIGRFRADLTQAACPVEVWDGVHWDTTPIQVADGRHRAHELAELWLRWMGLDGECYSLERPFTVEEVSDDDEA